MVPSEWVYFYILFKQFLAVNKRNATRFKKLDRRYDFLNKFYFYAYIQTTQCKNGTFLHTSEFIYFKLIFLHNLK